MLYFFQAVFIRNAFILVYCPRRGFLEGFNECSTPILTYHIHTRARARAHSHTHIHVYITVTRILLSCIAKIYAVSMTALGGDCELCLWRVTPSPLMFSVIRIKHALHCLNYSCKQQSFWR